MLKPAIRLSCFPSESFNGLIDFSTMQPANKNKKTGALLRAPVLLALSSFNLKLCYEERLSLPSCVDGTHLILRRILIFAVKSRLIPTPKIGYSWIADSRASIFLSRSLPSAEMATAAVRYFREKSLAAPTASRGQRQPKPASIQGAIESCSE